MAVGPLGETVNSVNTIIRVAGFGVPFLVIVVALITWMATGRMLRPTENIRSEIEEFTSQTLDQRIPVPETGDEVSRLAQTMNRMLHRLETAALRQQEFVSDASHELRSPVASIRANLEVSLAHPDGRAWPEVADDALTETTRLEQLIDDLLQLARIKEGADAPATSVNIAAIIRETTAIADGTNGIRVKA